MNPLKLITLIIVLFTFLISCSDDTLKKNINTAQPVTPEALQEDKLSSRSFKGSADLTEALYQELVSQSPELKTLEDDLEQVDTESQELEQAFGQYQNKSGEYYRSANAKASEITDSLLRNRMNALIAKSSKKNDTQTEELKVLLKRLAGNTTTLNDHHFALKIVLTLPLIEKYQASHKPETKAYKTLLSKQEQLIFRMDSLGLK